MRQRACKRHDEYPRPTGGTITRNNNTSQFFVTTKNTTQTLGGSNINHFDYRHVVFGKVVKGMEVIHQIQKEPRDRRTHRPLQAVIIEDCGQLATPTAEDDAPPTAAAPTAATTDEAESQAVGS